eukprot:CAMPEP_0201528172 /NCGR_PEP_ID=MMETSP0161_2-20130828/37527_1 /ASSEMBLY_ACC=CAM_ASM_000251 /TAXON_ID=180227 /ORGANISM="Neoparamoeba aestuarina, Strain SoJaBio B1-5/56/2" /LENGTH=57 /DNA_ID=CAMNT_0047929341 /DNA_START=43 /DNA_END=216 /DNA_ORIENTATION=-
MSCMKREEEVKGEEGEDNSKEASKSKGVRNYSLEVMTFLFVESEYRSDTPFPHSIFH